MKELADFIRSIVRPIVTIFFVANISLMVWQAVSVPEWYYVLAGGAVGWWFVERARKNNNI